MGIEDMTQSIKRDGGINIHLQKVHHFSKSIERDGGINIHLQKVRHFYLTSHHPP
jgi:hypothetical protein